MPAESRLNIYILGSELPPRLRERIQAQVSTGLRSLPSWAFDLLRQRIDALGVSSLPLIIEPQSAASGNAKVLSLGRIELRPAVKLSPRLDENSIDWGQDLRRLLAKAAGYICAPTDDDRDFWEPWAAAVQSDKLRDRVEATAESFAGETDLGLLIEMFAACALSPAHSSWKKMPAVRAFLDDWRGHSTAG